ncbi:MAG: DmsC/YnfH family molybdoenzyme membrane anchor subunit [Pseudomonadota bacterium]
MHPAKSVIVFTTLSGLGFGFMFFLGLGFGPADALVGPIACLFAMAAAGAGLVASTFHLGNPQRALKAFTQVGSSWLSREGVVSVILMGAFFLYAVLWFANGERNAILGLISAALAALAVICTAMIYAQLKTVPRWSNFFTVPMFLGFAGAGGVIATAIATRAAGEETPIGLGVALLLASGAAYAYRRFAQAVTLEGAGHSPESATQLGDLGRVRLLEKPHSAPNYLMKEMVFSVGRKHAEKLSMIFVIFGLFAPIFIYIFMREAAPGLAIPGLLLALLLHFGGALASRWLFFAEAEHVVGLYYGRR